ncbi:MAG TPA: SDR family oxidoreductase [Candidatus Eremiobacteraceae bacterium]|nr:SDR family oxidoreductase [Candidatus Eremiobacteraceae bacterium]
MDSKQVVMISGSSTGFGKLIAETLARRGHQVFATMRDPAVRNAANAAALRSLVGKENVALEVIEMDVTDEASVERAVHTVVEKAGRIDVAINNAGYALTGLEEAATLEQVRSLMDTNFLGCVRVNRAVLPFMRKQRSGLLMHISSGAGRVVLPGYGYYCASKFAMEAMAEAYHYELAQQGIESIVVPGPYQTLVINNAVQGADKARANSYGSVNEVAGKIERALTAAAADPQEVADVVAVIVETPAGQRKLRYRVSPTDLGVDAINEVCAQVQERAIEVFGIKAETEFAQRSAAGAD